ncbi:S8 family serine peptidase [Microvirga tunisiensis]|uniref:S8 family serine peptidase n=1 Tax=Pannonibacter tanglangensis TaxID=2750084 RepID=A0A7X5F3L9_9HYPH|nr:S8 family serine peptidase [Pannonibacter sp. XCT-53]NBN79158.1 S8 family serine peptidase [Pannonibacter sp. XCT-53]
MRIDSYALTGQWYLDGGGQIPGAGRAHLNLGSVWTATGGTGVSLAIVDDGVDRSHAGLLTATRDLFARAEALSGVDGDPVAFANGHGTAVAGIIAGAVLAGSPVGIAPGVQLASLRIFGEGGLSIRQAMDHLSDYDIANNSWSYSVGFFQATPAGHASYWSAIRTQVAEALTEGRDGLGTVIVKSAGNGRLEGRTSTDDLIANMDGVISVAATDHTGMVAYYSTPGSNILVSAPSSGAGRSITTLDVTGLAGYASGNSYDGFGGTSAAAPMVSGIVALMLAANPRLSHQDVADILALSARPTGSQTGAAPVGYESATRQANAADIWNGGGLQVSNDYGFGLVDAHQALRLAETWGIGRVPTERVEVTAAVTGWTAEAGGTVLRGSVTLADAVDLSTAVLGLSLSAGAEALRAVYLVSAEGSRSLVHSGASGLSATGGSLAWEFLTQMPRGEGAAGTWTVELQFATPVALAGIGLSASLELDGRRATPDTVHYYTADHGRFGTGVLADASGRTTINAAAIASDSRIDLTGATDTWLGGRSLAISRDTLVTTVITGDGDDRIVAHDRGVAVWSGRGNDTVTGGAGNDVFVDGAGNDVYQGGLGLDLLLLDRPHDAALVRVEAGPAGSLHLVHAGETDRLDGIERIGFTDGTTLAFDNDGTAGQLYRLYQTAFNRAPDADGYRSWLAAADAGASLAAIADAFTRSAEFNAIYNSLPSTRDKVAAFYSNSLGRSPDPSGLEAWSVMVASARTADAALLLGFSESVEKRLLTQTLFEDGFLF